MYVYAVIDVVLEMIKVYSGLIRERVKIRRTSSKRIITSRLHGSRI